MYYVYSMKLGTTGIVKVGYTNNPSRRASEHGRKYDCRKQVEILSTIKFTSKATAEAMERKLIDACKQAGLVMVKDKQAGDTERFYIDETLGTVTIKARKVEYEIKVS